MDKIFSEKINLLKALAIVLVVSGHLEFRLFDMFPPYSFQLALFFFISGMLFKDKYLDRVYEYVIKAMQPVARIRDSREFANCISQCPYVKNTRIEGIDLE